MHSSRAPLAVGLCFVALGISAPSAGSGRRIDAGHGLSIAVPAHWQLSHKRFTPCTNPIERFSISRGDQVLMLQERLVPARADLSGRPKRFRVRGAPAPIECCSLPGRRGWVLQFSDRGRAFYAYLYPGTGGAEPLLELLDSLRVRGREQASQRTTTARDAGGGV